MTEGRSASGSEPPVPRPAATVVPLREENDGLEVFVTVRPQEMRFMGGATVFPGGALADSDRDPRWAGASTLPRERAAQALGIDDADLALGLHVCALREAFEEVGLIAGTGPFERIARADADDPERFLMRCLDESVILATDRLVPAGRWVTPLGAPVRFDTHFFLIRAPEGWEPDPDPREVAESKWTTAKALLDELASGKALMAPPTVEMLQRLAAHRTVDDAAGALAEEGAGSGGHIISARLSPLVQVVLAPNANVMTGPGTNTYVVGTGPTAVIDPADDEPAYLEALLARAGDVAWVLVTHRHLDHIGGVSEVVARTGARVGAWGDEPAGVADVVALDDNTTIEIGGCTLTALHTPGHARDHLCFTLDGTASLFSGDNILGEGTAVIMPPDGNMGAYIETLERLLTLDIDRIYPGHWRPLDGGLAVIGSYLRHRKERERAVLDATAVPRTIDEIVALAYIDTPVEMHPIATFSALAHLEMLRDQGRVVLNGDKWRAR